MCGVAVDRWMQKPYNLQFIGQMAPASAKPAAIVLCVIQKITNFQDTAHVLPKKTSKSWGIEVLSSHEQEQLLTWRLCSGGCFASPLPPLTRERASRSLPWIPLCGTLYLHGEACAATPHPTPATVRCIFSRTFLASELICMSSFLMVAVKAIAFAPLTLSPPLRSFILW